MCHYDNTSLKQANRDETSFVIMESIIFHENRVALEDCFTSDKVDSVFADISEALEFVPPVLHIVVTFVLPSRLFSSTTVLSPRGDRNKEGRI